MLLEEILKELMTLKCRSIRQQGTPCFKTGKCNGQCAHFIRTCEEIEDWVAHTTYCENDYNITNKLS